MPHPGQLDRRLRARDSPADDRDPVGARPRRDPPLLARREADRRLGDPEGLVGDRLAGVAVHPRAPLANVGRLEAEAAVGQPLQASRREVGGAADEEETAGRVTELQQLDEASLRLAAAPHGTPLDDHRWGGEPPLQSVEIEVSRHGTGALAEERPGAGAGRAGFPEDRSSGFIEPAATPGSAMVEPSRHGRAPAGASARGTASASPTDTGNASTAPVGQARTQAPQPAQRSALKRMRRKVRTRSGTRKGPLGSWRAIRRSAAARAPRPVPAGAEKSWAGSNQSSCRIAPVGHALTQRPQPTHSSS